MLHPQPTLGKQCSESVYDEVVMRINKGQVVAGYPALTVRTFLRRCRFCTIVPATAAYDLKFDEREASAFLRELASLGLIESVDHIPRGEAEAYEIADRGLAFANATAARPITRRTAESAVAQFMERLHAVNANAEYLYRVESAVLFGSMLTETERLGDVDIAVKLSSKATGEEFDRRCDRRCVGQCRCRFCATQHLLCRRPFPLCVVFGCGVLDFCRLLLLDRQDVGPAIQ